MQAIADELVNTYGARFLHPGLFVAGAIGVLVLMSGLAAKLIDVGQDLALSLPKTPPEPAATSTVGPGHHCRTRPSHRGSRDRGSRDRGAVPLTHASHGIALPRRLGAGV